MRRETMFGAMRSHGESCDERQSESEDTDEDHVNT
jgi:hypothetical protein